MKDTINFAVLDDVLLAPPTRYSNIKQLLKARSIDGIGPAAEYAIQQSRYTDILPAVDCLPESLATASLNPILKQHNHSQSLSLEPLHTEFAALRSRDLLPERAGWVVFLKRLEGAARRVGFGNSMSAGFVGAVKELVDNVDLHSEAPNSGVVGYSFHGNTFEFVIADSGMGTLASLRKCAEYSHLCDHGDALVTALTDGESRFGRHTNHGLGFRQLFVSLAQLQGSLRFRSGDYRLEISGTSPTLPIARVLQTSYLQGFMAWIACRSATTEESP